VAPPVAPAPAPAPPVDVAPLPPPLPPPPPPAAEPAAPVFPEKLSVGKSGGFFQPGLLLQAWGIVTDDASHPATSTFRLRRAEIHVKGEIAPKLVGYRVMIDPSKLRLFNTSNVPVQGQDPAPIKAGTVAVQQPNGDFSILQDFFITFMSDYADVSIGQFKIPVSLEGFNGSSKLILPERFASSTKWGDKRDIGVKVEKKLGDYFFYSLGVYNGAGQNRFDDDNEKDVGLRIEVYPVKDLTIGGVGYTTVGTRDNSIRDRVEGDLRYDGGGFLLQGEFIHAWDATSKAKPKVEGNGGYGALGYTIDKKVQPVVRVGFLDPDIKTYGDLTGYYEGGLNYYLRGQEARLTAAVSVAVPNRGDKIWTEILMAQASF
jgi:hypothetical protein